VTFRAPRGDAPRINDAVWDGNSRLSTALRCATPLDELVLACGELLYALTEPPTLESGAAVLAGVSEATVRRVSALLLRGVRRVPQGGRRAG
jgi:hypothetical protein